jgi:cytochrome d ubiquinol oxidase subunit II
MDWTFWLPVIWAGIIVLGVIMYVLLDGFDLGVGILFPFAGEHAHRDVMMNTVAPIWDGNETWLVLGGAALFGAFPLAYSTILPGAYLPLLIMLIALIFRGVAFEFRFKADTSRHLWDKSFFGGSLAATFAQGLVLGTFIQGFEIEGRDFVGGMWDWLTPFSLLTGFALVAGYALLGCCWLIWKTEGDLQRWCQKLAPKLLVAVGVFVAVVSLWTPLQYPGIAERWFATPNIYYMWPIPFITLTLGLLHFRAVKRGHDLQPFLLTMAIFVMSFLGLGISLFPYIIPPEITIWDAAAPPESQVFLLVGVSILLPVTLVYTGFSYWVFRGKVTADDQYYH